MERYLTTMQNEALKVLKLSCKYRTCMPGIDKSLTHKVRNPKEKKRKEKTICGSAVLGQFSGGKSLTLGWKL